MSHPPFVHSAGSVKDDILVLRISTKEVRDMNVSRALRDEIGAMVSDYGGNKVVVDMGQVEFIGSVGLLALLGLRRQLSEKHGRVVVCNLRAAVRDMFVACRLISTEQPQSAPFEAAETEEEALAQLAT